MTTLSDNLKYMRLLRKLSVSEVSRELNCAPNTLTNWEKGKISPPAEAVEKLCSIYKISPSEIFGWEKSPELETFRQEQDYYIKEITDLEARKAALDKEIQQKKMQLYGKMFADVYSKKHNSHETTNEP
jgi:transcriptional regulator with XRE-family HTH domain